MARALTLTPHHSTAELWTHYRSCRKAIEQRRTQAIALLSEGRKASEVKRLTHLSGPAYAKIVGSYNAAGLAGLRDGRHANAGRPTLLSDEQVLTLVEAARRDHAQGVSWTAPQLQTFVEDMIGASINPRRSYELLGLVNLSLQPDPSRKTRSHNAAALKRLERLGLLPQQERAGIGSS